MPANDKSDESIRASVTLGFSLRYPHHHEDDDTPLLDEIIKEEEKVVSVITKLKKALTCTLL